MQKIDPLLQDTSEALSKLSKLVYEATDPSDRDHLRELERDLSGQLSGLLSTKEISGTDDIEGYENAKSAARYANKAMESLPADQPPARPADDAIIPLIKALSRLLVSV